MCKWLTSSSGVILTEYVTPLFCSYMSDGESWMELADLYVQVNE